MKRINALKARSRLGTILDEVSKKKEHYLIERLSKPLVAVIPVEEYEAKNKKENKRAEKVGQAIKEMDEWRKRYGNRLKGWDVVETIRKAREDRTSRILKASENDRS